MQAGMLFQSLLGQSSRGEGYDIEQMHMVFAEPLVPAVLARAWTLVSRRHPLLSSSFRWEGVSRPEQRVEANVSVTVEVEDWSGLTEDERSRRLTEFLARDRARAFDLTHAPLMRLTVFPIGSQRAEVVWTFHHLLLDGRSMPQVLVEAFDAYAALVRGDSPEFPPAPRPYRDYIDWLAARDTAPSLDFFRKLLRGKATPTPLPLSEPAGRPLAGAGYGEAVFRVEPAVAERARAFVKTNGATLGTLVQAAWALVLGRTTGQDDVVFGTTRACRRSALDGDAESMIGLFINTLPVRAALSDASSVGELLATLRGQSLALRDHEHTPLVEVQGVSDIPRGTPLFETLLMFENRELNHALRAADARWAERTVALHEQPSPPLTVTVFDDQELEIRVLYDRRRFRDAVVERITGYLATAIAELSLDIHRKLASVDVLPEAERRGILLDWNRTSRPFEVSLIHAPFEERARLQPNAVAVEGDGSMTDGVRKHETLTYSALDARANRLAQALVARGAGPGEFVGICLERGIDLVVALLAVAKSGAAYVPLDPAYPVDRIAFMLEDAKTLLVVTEARHQALFARTSNAAAPGAAGACPTLVVDGPDAAAIAAMPPVVPARTAEAGDVCYAIYTSGSTGRPKGVVLTHEAVVNTFDWVSRTFGVGPGDRLLFVTSPCFDLSVYDTFGALGAGATVVVAGRELLADPEALAAAIVDRHITIWDSAPAALQRLTPFFPPAAADSALRLVMLSGDWIPLSLPDTLRDAFPRARIMSLGGATEAAIWSNWYAIETIDPRWSSIPYGRPIQNARYHVLDARMRPVPPGVAGDLYIGGTCLAQGYLHQPELTAERFVRDPFSEIPGQRLYKTGDLARYFDDGEIEFLGRADFQVKIRGYRVELGEVEAALAQAPGVRDAVCVACKDASGQKSLVGYVVARDGATIDPEAIKAYVATRLTDFMVPSQIVALAAIPLSPNGKVDRPALPDPSSGAAATDMVAPRSVFERKMASIWQELLRRDRVGLNDDFFALGGHSLLAVMLVSRIERDFGVKVRLSSVLQNPTVGKLAAAVQGATPADQHRKHLVTLNGEGTRPPLFLVSGAGGFGFCFHGIARFVRDRHPVHVLNAIGAEDDREGVERTIEAAAEIYLPQILAAAPRGPIIIGGYSFGVLVAFELAHRLRDLGREVPLMISFDGFAPGYPEQMTLPRRVLDHVKELLRGHAREYARARLANLRGRVLEKLGRAEDRLPAIPDADAETDRRLRRLEAALWRARGLYKPTRRWTGELLLLKTSLSERWLGNHMDDPLYGWRAHTSGAITVSTVMGGHHSMFEEDNQRLMAEAILGSTASLEQPPAPVSVRPLASPMSVRSPASVAPGPASAAPPSVRPRLRSFHN
jgi:amino acid adenylation domain-containing protein